MYGIFFLYNNHVILQLCAVAVVYAYEQCLQTMGFHPNVWCEAALYLEQVSQKMMDKGVSGFVYNGSNIYYMAQHL